MTHHHAKPIRKKLRELAGLAMLLVDVDYDGNIFDMDRTVFFAKDSERTNYIIQNWMRSRSTIEFIGLWELLHNPDFKGIEFDAFKNEADNLNKCYRHHFQIR
jgi:hypothetical protein